MYVVSFDPGGTTGYCIFRDADLLKHGTFPNWQGVEDVLRQALKFRASAHIVCEKFMLYPWKSQEQAFSTFETVEVIGVIKFLSNWLKLGDVYMSPTVDKKRFPDNRLKMLGYSTDSKHSRDAIRHALCYLSDNKNQPFIDKVMGVTFG